MIEGIYKRSGGMALVSRRLFSPLPMPSLPAAWTYAARDPFILLENGLAAIIEPAERAQHAEFSEVRHSELRKPVMDSPAAFQSSVAEWASNTLPHTPAERAAEYPSIPQSRRTEPHVFPSSSSTGPGNVHDASKPRSTVPASKQGPLKNVFDDHDRTKQGTYPQFTYPEGRQAENTGPGGAHDRSRRNESLFSRQSRVPSAKSGGASERLWTTTTPENGTRRNQDRFPQQQTDLSSTANGGVFDDPRETATENLHRFPAHRRASTLQGSQEREPTGNSRLVETSGLIRLLKRNTVSLKPPEASSEEPVMIPQDQSAAQPLSPAARSAPATLTVDAVLDELEDRLRFEFLRSYGSSGE